MNPLINIVGGRLLNAVLDNFLKGRDHHDTREERLERDLASLQTLKDAVPPESLDTPVTAPEEVEEEESPDTSGTSQLSAAGKACVPCSADHFSTVAGALSEALRFARSDGIDHPEVLSRVALCFDELNIMERVDAAPERVEELPKEEKALMQGATVTSRGLRHKLTDLTSIKDLEAATAEAQRARTDFRNQLFQLQFRKLKPEDREKVKERAKEMVEEQFETEEEADGSDE
ncbi:MAG: hypothetical protein ABIH46_05655 [Chloroflexota bacterium]